MGRVNSNKSATVVELTEEKSGYSDVLRLSTVGLTLVFAIAIGAGAGMWLDDRLGTKPALTVVGFFLGVTAGFMELLRNIKAR